MTEERQKELSDIVDKAKQDAHAAARALYGSGVIGPTMGIVNAARLDVIESVVISLLGFNSSHEGELAEKMFLEMRDYWNNVTEVIKR